MSAGLDVAARGTVSAADTGAGARLRAAARSSVLWIVGAALALIATIIMFLTSAGNKETRPQHFDSYRDTGARAYIEVLHSHGVDVRTTESAEEARSLAAKPDTTVVVARSDELDPEAAKGLSAAVGDAGGDLVLVDPFSSISRYSTAVTAAVGEGTEDAAQDDSQEITEPRCDLAVAQRAGRVTAPLHNYGPTGRQAVRSCYSRASSQTGFGGFARTQLGHGNLTVLGSPDWLSNRGLAQQGNAALTIGATATHSHVVYLYPGQPASTGEDSGGNLLALVPSWFRVLLLWTLPVLLALALWRGRRLGPLAVERLPVIVPPIESVIGRAGLMQRSSSREATLHTLRTAALLRIARSLVLPGTARPPDICTAAAQATGRPVEQVEYALLFAQPRTNPALVELSQTIATIESEVDDR